MIYLNMPVGELYGWAICGKYLLREMANKVPVGYIEGGFSERVAEDVDKAMVDALRVPDAITKGTIIHTLTPDMRKSCNSWGCRNIGYMFYEEDFLTDKQIENLKHFDVAVAGSEWNASVIRKHGIDCVAIPQGVDQSIFKYKPKDRERFVIFSGGKWEHRKSQKAVLEAFKKLSHKYKDVYLIASWDNLFDVKSSYEIAESINGIQNLLYIGLQNHKNLAAFMHETDIGVFPNLAEGGTNLVLMEYLSCGRTAIVNTSTGQKDVVTKDYAYLMDSPDVDEIVDRLDHAYRNRPEIEEKGALAHKAMGYFTWDRMAERFLAL
jgi:glycosyltransferase involved in cell wall biosynthesis